MSFVDHEGSVEFPFSQKTVFKAIMDAAPNINGLELDSADELSGRLKFKAGVSLASWGENIPVQLVSISPTRTQVKIISSPKTGAMFGGAMDMGKNRANIEKIISAISKELANKPAEQEAPQASNVSAADEILKLKQLLDAGALTQEEFDEQKKKLLEKGVTDTKPAPVVSQVAQTTSTPSVDGSPVHIEGDGEDNSTMYAIIAIVVFVVIFFLFMAM